MMALFAASALAMFALWALTFVSTRKRWRASRAEAFASGTLAVWPALTISSGALVGEVAYQGIDEPVGPAVAYLFAGAAALMLAVWLLGWSIAAISGWFLQSPVEN
jgi:hypothetical protein